MRNASELNINSTAEVAYNSTLIGSEELSIQQTEYLKYNNNRIGGRKENISPTANSIVVGGLPTNIHFNPSSASKTFTGLNFYMPKYSFDDTSKTWVQDDVALHISRVQVDANYTRIGTTNYYWGRIVFTQQSPTTVGLAWCCYDAAFNHIYVNMRRVSFGISDLFINGPVTVYSKSELDDYIDETFAGYTDTITTLKAANTYGGVACKKNNLIQFMNRDNQVWHYSGDSEGTFLMWHSDVTTYNPTFFNSDAVFSDKKLNPVCIFPFASANEFLAAKCTRADWSNIF